MSKSKFGGLNLLSGSTTLPVDDSPSLLNVDFDISGSVQKRKGTVTVFKDTSSAYPVYVSSFITQLGKEFFVSKYGLELRVLDLVDNVSTKIWSKSNVFRDFSVQPFSIALEDNTVLLVGERHAPIQLRILETSYTIPTTSTSINVVVDGSWVNAYADLTCYVNGVKVTPTASYSGGVITLSGLTFNAGDTVYVVSFLWQWWAEALIWYGDSFYQRVSRFGASQEDQHVQIPNSIVTDEIPDNTNYGVYAYLSDTFNQTYTYKSNNQPKISVEYSFSDGSNYTADTTSYTSPSKFYVTFGDISSPNPRTFTDKDITGNRIRIVKHLYKDYDIVNFTNTDGAVPTGITVGTAYYVKVIDDDTIELYTDSALTTIVTLTARLSKNFTDLGIDYTDNFIAITSHGFTTGSGVRFTTSGTLPIGLSENTTYYLNVLNANAFEVFFDAALRKKVIFVYRAELFFNSTNVSGNILTINSHNLFTGDAVRVRTANGTLSATLNATTVYYVKVLTANAIQLFSDSTLATIVPNYTGLTGDVFLYLDGGVHTIFKDGLTTSVERVAYDVVSFIRLRQLRFNKGSGVLPVNLQVFVDDVLATRNTALTASVATHAYYTHTSETLTPNTTSVKQKFVSFSAKTPIGVSKDSLVTLVNTETRWCGAAALPQKYNYDNGSYVPAYGIGDYADYLNGEFPLFGTLYQNRLCLCGVGSPFIVSAIYDKIIQNAPYRYFQITDDLSNPLLDPFKVRIPLNKSDSTTAIKQWQQYLFVFTNTSTYRTILDNNGQFNTNVNSLLLSSNVGCISRDCVSVTENTMIFLSEGGVFDMGVLLQNEYRASEISVPIRPAIQEFTSNALMVYDSFNKKLFVYDERLFVYYPESKVWSEWSAIIGWNISSLTVSKNAALFCCTVLCDFQIVKTEFDKYIDFAKVFSGGSTVSIEPCLKKIPCYAGVNVYKSPVPFVQDNTVEDILVRVDLKPIEFGAAWRKLEDGYIYINAPVDGTLYFSPLLEDSFYGVIGYQDNVKMSLTDTSLGIVSPVDVCTTKRSVYYTSLVINYTDGTTFVVDNSEYTTYADLVSFGTLPTEIEPISRTDGYTTFSTYSTANDITLKPGELVVVGDTVGKAFDSWVATIELWSTTDTIEFNRFAERFLNDGVTSFTATLFGGNPADRTTKGVLQPNGLYKGIVSIPISVFSQSEIHITNRYNASSVPIKPNVVIVVVP